MAVYRFRVTLEDNEEVYREIEIRSTQTYEDFHKSILESINFDNTHNASFFISDDMWRKGEEIVLKPTETPENSRRNAEVAKRLMSKCKMAALIDDPHQKFVYIYDYKAGWTFTIELVKILLDDANKRYPDCVKSVGEAPKQYKKTEAVVPVEDEDDFDDDEPQTDDEAYTVAASADDDIAELEGEEGEEELVEAEEEAEGGEEDEFGFSEFESGPEGGDDD
ncbi:MAG: hypothetical protein WAQ28_14075 [Bacteroidia bacterium]|jgi:hypothetical protein